MEVVTAMSDEFRSQNPAQGHQWDAADYAWDGVALTAVRRPRQGNSPGFTSTTATYAEFLGQDLPIISTKAPHFASKPKLICQIQGCDRSLVNSKLYYQRFRLCEEHLKSPAIVVDGALSRLCQQCGRFHELSAFEGKKRTCRAQLDRIRTAKQQRKQQRTGGSGDSPGRDGNERSGDGEDAARARDGSRSTGPSGGIGSTSSGGSGSAGGAPRASGSAGTDGVAVGPVYPPTHGPGAGLDEPRARVGAQNAAYTSSPGPGPADTALPSTGSGGGGEQPGSRGPPSGGAPGVTSSGTGVQSATLPPRQESSGLASRGWQPQPQDMPLALQAPAEYGAAAAGQQSMVAFPGPSGLARPPARSLSAMPGGFAPGDRPLWLDAAPGLQSAVERSTHGMHSALGAPPAGQPTGAGGARPFGGQVGFASHGHSATLWAAQPIMGAAHRQLHTVGPGGSPDSGLLEAGNGSRAAGAQPLATAAHKLDQELEAIMSELWEADPLCSGGPFGTQQAPLSASADPSGLGGTSASRYAASRDVSSAASMFAGATTRTGPGVASTGHGSSHLWPGQGGLPLFAGMETFPGGASDRSRCMAAPNAALLDGSSSSAGMYTSAAPSASTGPGSAAPAHPGTWAGSMPPRGTMGMWSQCMEGGGGAEACGALAQQAGAGPSVGATSFQQMQYQEQRLGLQSEQDPQQLVRWQAQPSGGPGPMKVNQMHMQPDAYTAQQMLFASSGQGMMRSAPCARHPSGPTTSLPVEPAMYNTEQWGAGGVRAGAYPTLEAAASAAGAFAAQSAAAACGGAARAPASAGSQGEHLEYVPQDFMSRLTLKMMNCLPGDLPPMLRTNMQRWVSSAGAAEVMQACMRPGCLELVVDVAHCCPIRQFADAVMARGDPEAALRALTCVVTDKLAADNELVLEVGGSVLRCAPGGQPRLCSWEEAVLSDAGPDGDQNAPYPAAAAASAAAASPAEGHADGRNSSSQGVPTLNPATCTQPVICSCDMAAVRHAPVVSLTLTGSGLGSRGVQLLARMGGQTVQLASRKVGAAGTSEDADDCSGSGGGGGSSLTRVGVQLCLPRVSGLLMLEARRGALLGPWWPVLVLRDAEAAAELNAFVWEERQQAAGRAQAAEQEKHSTGPDWLLPLLIDMGQVLDWLGWRGLDREVEEIGMAADDNASGGTWGSESGGAGTSGSAASGGGSSPAKEQSGAEESAAAGVSALPANEASRDSDAAGTTLAASSYLASADGRPTGSTPATGAFGSSTGAGGATWDVHALAALQQAEQALERRMSQKACRLLAFCVLRGLQAMSDTLWSVLTLQRVAMSAVLKAARYQGDGLLACAVRSRSVPIMRSLLRRGHGVWEAAELTRAGPSGLSPLHLAASLPGCDTVAAALLGTVPGAAQLWFSAEGPPGSGVPAASILAERSGNSALNDYASQLLQVRVVTSRTPAHTGSASATAHADSGAPRSLGSRVFSQGHGGAQVEPWLPGGPEEAGEDWFAGPGQLEAATDTGGHQAAVQKAEQKAEQKVEQSAEAKAGQKPEPVCSEVEPALLQLPDAAMAAPAPAVPNGPAGPGTSGAGQVAAVEGRRPKRASSGLATWFKGLMLGKKSGGGPK